MKSAPSEKSLREFAKETAAKVSHWPQWKGGGVADPTIYECSDDAQGGNGGGRATHRRASEEPERE